MLFGQDQLPILPVALRVVWFVLSFTGIIASWVVLSIFSRAVNSYWGPMLYCVFMTMIQGIFCLGLIYRMDPFQMPRAFCITQTFIIYYSSWSLTGVCAAFTFATTSTVLWPTNTRLTATSTLAWNNKYYFPIFVFPLACLSIAAPVLLKLDAIQPTQDLHCDATHPEWGRFLGYAGISYILTIPCFFLSAAAALRVMKMHLSNQRSTRYQSRSPLGQIGQIGERDVIPPALTSPITVQNIFSPPPLDPEIPITLRSPKAGLTAPDVGEHPMADYVDNGDELTDPSATSTFGYPAHHAKMPPQWTVTATIDENNDVDGRRRTVAMVMSSSTRTVPNKPNLAPAIWRLILFQMAFFLVELLAALSTIIDVATSRPTPTPFGSQHISLVLVGWGPAFVFGHLPAVRRKLMFWKR